MSEIAATQIVQIGVEKEITLDQLHAAIDGVLKELGCPACGLVGFDIRLRRDIDLRSRLKNLQGITTISQVSLR